MQMTGVRAGALVVLVVALVLLIIAYRTGTTWIHGGLVRRDEYPSAFWIGVSVLLMGALVSVLVLFE
jgi:hypothetical protein